MRNLEDFFGPFQPEISELPDESEFPDERELAAKKALGLHFPEQPFFRQRLNRAVADCMLSPPPARKAKLDRLTGAKVNRDPAVAALVHQTWFLAGIAREAYQRQSGPRGNRVIDGDNLFIGERDLEDGCSSGLHVVGDGMVSEALMGHVFRDGEDRKNLQYLRRCFGPAVQLHPTAPLAIGVFTGEDRQVLGVAQENTLRGVEILRDEQGRFHFQAFPPQRVDLSWVLG